MSKEPSKTSTPKPESDVKRPEGRRYTGDVIGFRDLEKQGPIHGIPRAVKLSDNSQDTAKPSAFVIFELVQPCKVYESGEGDTIREFPASKGEMVGVWVKGAWKPIVNLCGVEVYIEHTGEKTLKGRPKSQKPMKTFDFILTSANKGARIPVIEDNRKDSAHVSTMFDVKNPKPATREPGDDTEEELQF